MSGRAPVYDAVVVGAGPGGSAAARGCAERGCRVLLLEKRRRPRHKMCSDLRPRHMQGDDALIFESAVRFLQRAIR